MLKALSGSHKLLVQTIFEIVGYVDHATVSPIAIDIQLPDDQVNQQKVEYTVYQRAASSWAGRASDVGG